MKFLLMNSWITCMIRTQIKMKMSKMYEVGYGDSDSDDTNNDK